MISEQSRLYRLMVYFAHSTMVIYSKTIVSREDMTVDEFRSANPEMLKRVFDEGLSIMKYELSSHQIDRAIAVYLKCEYRPDSVEETETYTTTHHHER